jgi:hypothetical protein
MSDFRNNPDSSLTKNDYLILALKGGFPEALRSHDEAERRSWHTDYLEALLEHDLKDIANLRRRASLYKLFEALCAWSSKYMDVTAIGKALTLTHGTLDAYIGAIETLYLIDRIRPWANTDYGRVGKKDKLFLVDTGLMASCLNWTLDKVALNGDLNGKLIETYVYTQLVALMDAQTDRFNLSHYRDREQREVDFIIEGPDEAVIGIEVKSGTHVGSDSFKHLRWFRDHMAKDRLFIGIVLYSGAQSVSFEENLWALPISSLWHA